MSQARILILSSSHLCRNPRTLKEAATLGAAGYDVTVLTVLSSERFLAMDRRLLSGQPFRCEYVDLVGTNRAGRLRSYLQRGVTKIARHLLGWSRLETAQALGPAHLLLRAARRRPADLTIAHTEIPLWAVCRLQQDGRRVAVDFEDWYSEDLLADDRRHRPLQLLRAAENHALHRACYCSTTSRSLAGMLHGRYGGRPAIVVRNTFSLQHHHRLERPEAAAPRLVWFSQTIGPGRGLEWFLPAWAKSIPSSRLSLIGDIRPDFRAHLLGLVPVGRRTDLEILPLIPPEDLPQKLTEFDIGLALEPRQPLNKDVTISNKIFQYLNAGLAVLATSTAGQREVMELAGDCGLLLADALPQLGSQLDGLLADHRRIRLMQTAARAAAEREFSWEIDAPRLLAAVAEALARPALSAT